jgi:hypothetical protein
MSLGSERTLGDAVSDLTEELDDVDHGWTDPVDEDGVARTFSRRWSRRRWARLLDDHARWSEWTASTVMVTMTARTRWQETGDPVPYVDHFDALVSSRNAVTTALSRAMEDVQRWQTVTVFGAHASGHLHLHTGVWADQVVDPERFAGVLGAHVRNCCLAGQEAHGLEDGAVTVATDDFGGLPAELGRNAPGLDARGHDDHGLVSTSPRTRQLAGAAVLEEAGARPIRWG